MASLEWLAVGLIAGWLAGKVMRGGGYGVVVDIIPGIVGGILGGGTSECWESGTAAGSLDRSSWLLSGR